MCNSDNPIEWLKQPKVFYSADDSSIKVGESTQDGDMGIGIHQVQAQKDDSTELDFHSAEIPKRKVSTL